MKALVLKTAARTASVKEVPRPVPGPGEVLIRVHAVALNPVDQIHFAGPIAAQDERVMGTDFAGVVVGRGEGLSGASGDARTVDGARVAGFVQGGAFFHMHVKLTRSLLDGGCEVEWGEMRREVAD